MNDSHRICNCVEWLLVAVAAAEALEHNAMVSGMSEDLHLDLKDVLTKQKLEDLEDEHVLLRGYIIERMAEFGLSGSLGTIRDRCNIDITEASKLAKAGYEAIDKKDSGIALYNFTKLKGVLVGMAQDICGLPKT